MVAVAMVVAKAVAAVVRAAAVAIMTGVAVLRQARTISQVCARLIADLCLMGCNVMQCNVMCCTNLYAGFSSCFIVQVAS